MATIAPFAGIYYQSDAPLAELIAPPYDVLSTAQQDALYAKNPDNIVRLILSKEQASDSETENRYTRAAAFLRDRLASGVLVQDETPALYEYIQRFEHPLDPERIVFAADAAGRAETGAVFRRSCSAARGDAPQSENRPPEPDADHAGQRRTDLWPL